MEATIFDKSIKPSLKNLFHPPGADLLKQAELIWIKDAQIALKEQIKKGYLCRLNPMEQNGIIKVGGNKDFSENQVGTFKKVGVKIVGGNGDVIGNYQICLLSHVIISFMTIIHFIKSYFFII